MPKTQPQSHHEQAVSQYYTDHTEKSYMAQWDSDNIHLGLFEEGESIAFCELIPERALIKKRAIQRMTEAVIGPARIQSSDIVVDAGCGIAGTAIYIAQTYRCQVIGINICQHQLDIAAHKVASAQNGSLIQLKFADCSRHLPFPDHSVDVIVNIESACHYSNRRQFLSECKRILKPTGRIAAQDVVYSTDTSAEDYTKYIVPLCEAWRLSKLETPQSYKEILEDSGFKVIELIDLRDGIKPNIDHMNGVSQLIASHNSTLTEDEQLWQHQRTTLAAAYYKTLFTAIRYLATT